MWGLYRTLPGPHQGLILLSLFLVLVALMLPSGKTLAARHSDPIPTHTRHDLGLSLPPSLAAAENPRLEWRPFEVRAGDSLARLFDRAGLSPQTLHAISQLPQAGQTLVKIMPGQVIELGFEGETLAALSYAIDGQRTLKVSRDESGFLETVEEKAVEKRQFFASAEITSNFWNAAVGAGLSANQIMRLAGIFGWDVDFALDIRAGDHFAVIYEQDYIEGQFVGDGDILVAEFSNQGETFRAVRYSDGNYYNETGNAMRKAFLRAPVQFNYVSSNFNPRRLHPVTGRVRPHNGTDYVAPVGTPIMAAGDGTVVASSYNQYNGHYVFIKHSNTYVTKYLHLSKRSVRKGQRVRQGQTIGKLGATGRVTGAHLHYEFLVNGVHRNPRTVKLPESRPIADSERAAFTELSEQRLAQLAHRQSILLAMEPAAQEEQP
ncbi:peptidoglycan DD-metalloendopeptidase family protein [Ferrimonas balearica]|uniref:peptidoglycan DD-metalloendopeptidase family protein n=1 Tax=Ferrimonas balearica TaxID=44012 RepID=UPI001C99BAB3|nr:peptidoglycan DD-metalloendopeptidase family protein [Ferrimonas balearica]